MRDGERLVLARQQSASWSTRFGQAVDHAIAAIAPGWAMRRLRARAATSVLSAYRGAEQSRIRRDWRPGAGSADADLLADLPTLRERSRDLNRNDAYASAITNTVVVNTVGSGIKPQCRLNQEMLGISEEEARLFERAAERAWRRWCPFADAQGRLEFNAMQSLVQRQILENGELFVLPLMITDEPWRPYRLGLEVIEADRVATPSDKLSDPNIRDGIELGTRGQPIAYWVRKTHPGDLFLNGITSKNSDLSSAAFTRIPARNRVNGRPNVLHLFWTKRPGQSRGEPFFAPVLSTFKDLADSVEAAVVTLRIAACFSAFVETSDPFGAAQANSSGTNAQGQRIQEVEPGMIEYLGIGQSIKFGQPNGPGAMFEPFMLMVLRSIGAALGLPLELVLKDFSRTNYSSARSAMLEARKFFKGYQQWLIQHFCQPVWEMVQEEAWLRQHLPAVDLIGEDRDEWLRAIWIAPGWGWVDPVKEVESSTMAIDANLSTLADECAAQGRDWEDVLAQRKREQDLKKTLGIEDAEPIVPKPSPAADQSETQPQDEPVGANA